MKTLSVIVWVLVVLSIVAILVYFLFFAKPVSVPVSVTKQMERSYTIQTGNSIDLKVISTGGTGIFGYRWQMAPTPSGASDLAWHFVLPASDPPSTEATLKVQGISSNNGSFYRVFVSQLDDESNLEISNATHIVVT